MNQIPNLTKEEFQNVLKQVPLCVVELIIIKNGKILLTKRTIEPFKGVWHIPGGFVGYNETLEEASKRILKKECGVNEGSFTYIGFYNSIDFDPRGHLIAHIFKTEISDDAKDTEEGKVGFFDQIPENIISYHIPIIKYIFDGTVPPKKFHLLNI